MLSRDLNHLDIPHIISVHYSDDIMLIISEEQEVASTLDVLVNTSELDWR